MGSVTTFGGVNYHHVAFWDGHGWHPLGAGVNNSVNAIAVLGTQVYVGGSFTAAGALTVSHVAMWNGSAWSALNGGVTYAASGTPEVLALTATGTVTGPQIYVGGEFDTAGGFPALNIAEWNGTRWLALAAGLTNFKVSALTTSGTTLYAGGNFTGSGKTKLDSLAQWNGASWLPVGGAGVSTNSFNGSVSALTTGGGKLYIAGSFATVGGSFGSSIFVTGGVSAKNAAVWDGASWAPLGAGLPAAASSVAYWSGKLYAVGQFANSGPQASIAVWDGMVWGSVGGGVSGANTTPAVAASATGVVVGGLAGTDSTGRVALNGLGFWNGTAWGGYGLGLNEAVSVLAGTGSTVYAAGNFTNAGATVTGGIARSTGSTWTSLTKSVTVRADFCADSGAEGICTIAIDPATG